MYIDTMGSLIGVVKGREPKKVMVAAHMDEISFMVTHIDDEGFIRFHPLGGFDPKTLSAQRVIVHGREDIMGVMGSKPVHLMTPEEKNKNPQLRDYFIDTGRSAAQVKELVDIGDPITRERDLIMMGECINGKSLDNRVSVYILIEVLKALKGKSLPFDFYAAFTVQEEVGLYGADMIADTIKPNIAIITDVTHDSTTPMIEKKKEGDLKCGDGPVIYFAPSVHHKVRELIIDTAKTKKIPYQRAASSRATGTDTDAFAHSNGGVPSALISLPLRYMHTTVEMVAKEDVANVIQLIYETLLKITPDMKLKYH